MEARELLADETTWTARVAGAAIPILIRRALDGELITYGDLKMLVEPGSTNNKARHYNYPAGRIGDICEAAADEMGESFAPLSIIIVNQSTQLPSSGVNGYLASYLGLSRKAISRLSAADRNDYARQAIGAVFDYDGWHRVAKYLGVKVPRHPNVVRSSPVTDDLPDPAAFAYGPESAAHKALKAWVCAHPECLIRFGRFGQGSMEARLSSGDRLDVHFMRGGLQLAVEVKARDASGAEIERGIFQCVKYRATLRAMQSVSGEVPNGRSVLVLGSRPNDRQKRLATLLSVSILVVDSDDHDYVLSATNN